MNNLQKKHIRKALQKRYKKRLTRIYIFRALGHKFLELLGEKNKIEHRKNASFYIHKLVVSTVKMEENKITVDLSPLKKLFNPKS